jgi:ubiquinone/menaquinone biosynthesis C-methylase UbiE
MLFPFQAMKRYIIIPFLIIVQSLSAQDPWKNVYTESAWAERDRWQRADEIIRYLKVRSGSKVADIGCHEGYMTMKLSLSVASTGKIFSVDVQQSKLDKLKDHLAKRKITNVTLIKGDYDNPKLPVNTLDAVIILDSYHEMDAHDKILHHIKEALKPGGRLVLCEPIAPERRKSTREDQERKHELGISYALGDLQKAGFTILTQQDPFADRMNVKGDAMWLIVAVKN